MPVLYMLFSLYKDYRTLYMHIITISNLCPCFDVFIFCSCFDDSVYDCFQYKPTHFWITVISVSLTLYRYEEIFQVIDFYNSFLQVILRIWMYFTPFVYSRVYLHMIRLCDIGITQMYAIIFIKVSSFFYSIRFFTLFKLGYGQMISL